jgi:hypothetical protein
MTNRTGRKGRFRSLPALLVLAVGAFSLTACQEGDFRPHAVGPEGTINIVMDSTRWNGPLGEAVRSELGQFIQTLPAPERAFDLQLHALQSASDLERVKRLKNVVFVAPLSDTTNEARFLQSRIDERGREAILNGGRVAYIHRPDLWRRDQMVMYVTAGDESALIRALQDNGDNMRYVFNRITRDRLSQDMFRRGRQTELETRLMETHGFAVNGQHDFLLAKDTTDFVWLRRILSDSWRSVFVHYIDNASPAMLDPEWIYATRDSLTREYVQGNLGGFVEIDRRRPLTTREVDFLGRFGYETRGLWHMVGEDENGGRVPFGMGGPFVSYAFYDEPSGRLYLIDGMVFAPNHGKRDFLRHMEVIAHTFRTAGDERNVTTTAGR